MLVILLKSNNSFPLNFEYIPNYLTWPSDPAPAFVLNFISGGLPFLSHSAAATVLTVPS